MSIFPIGAAVFIIALLYSAIGHGGASGYLAVLALSGAAAAEMSTTALVLNIFVAGIAWWQYAHTGHFEHRPALPLIIASVPAAFLGGALRIGGAVFNILLALTLVAAALRLSLVIPARETAAMPALRQLVLLPVGAGIGLLSGIVGIGGGIFLSPLLLSLGWATAKQTAAISAAFIVCNSISGIAGRMFRGSFAIGGWYWLIPVAIVGGWLGARLGAKRLPHPALRVMLAIVLLIAAVKLVLQHIK